MIDIGSFRAHSCQGISRRAFLRAGLLAPLALSGLNTSAAESRRARSVLLALALGRAEPPRYLRSQAERAGRIPWAVRDDRHTNPGRSLHGAVAAAGRPQRPIHADPLQQELPRRPPGGRHHRADRLGRGVRRPGAELRLDPGPAARRRRSAAVHGHRAAAIRATSSA